MRKVLLISSYLSNIGGTEIEAVNTAVLLAQSRKFRKVAIFSHEPLHVELGKFFLNNSSVEIRSFPKFYKSWIVNFIDTAFNRLGFRVKVSEIVYIRCLIYFYSDFYFLTYPNNSLAGLFMKYIPKGKKIVLKITMRYFEDFNTNILKRIYDLTAVLVFSSHQKFFLEAKYRLKNVIVSDISIAFEQRFLELKQAKFQSETVRFGFVGRIAPEKNIIDMIKLMEFLKSKHIQFEFFIRGEGQKEYSELIKNYILQSPAFSHITFDNSQISPFELNSFYDSIDVFLVTSIHEGGPITALEAVAAGRMIFCYDVGSISERFGMFDYIVNLDLINLCENVLAFLKLNNNQKAKFVYDLRTHYKLRLANAEKNKRLIECFNN